MSLTEREQIDKQKLLEWLDNKAGARLYDGVYRALIEVFNEIKSGTFDDHSAQEEIAKLNSWIKNAEAKEKHYDELRHMFNAMEARAMQAEQRWKEEHKAHTKRIAQFNDEKSARIQAEQERDKWRELSDKAQALLDPIQADRERLTEERNALLETMKEIAKHPCTYCADYKLARSIIAKIEGEAPNGEMHIPDGC